MWYIVPEAIDNINLVYINCCFQVGLISRASIAVFPPKDYVEKLKSSLLMVCIMFVVDWFVCD